jgi:hypothetical protein
MLSNVPVPGQTLDNSRPIINNNFQTIDTTFSINHVQYRDGSNNGGKHAFVQFPVQTVIPSGIVTGDIDLYNKLPAAPYPQTGTNELFLVKSDGATQIPITASIQSASAGWSYLPSGILIKWGTILGNYPNGTWQQFTLPAASNIPVFNNVFSISLQSVSQDVPPGAQTQTYNYLTVASNFTTTGFWWIPRTNFGNVNQKQLTYFIIGN